MVRLLLGEFLLAIQNISPAQLLLDVENPRFGLSESSSQSEALRYLFENSDLKELWYSIVENGFLPFEPLVAYQVSGTNEFVVVEGNRRLAAVKSLLDPSIIRGFSKTSVPTVPAIHQNSLLGLPVTVINNRNDADEYIGYRHVNGSRNWEPLAKARFGLKLLTKLRKNQGLTDKERVDVLARQIGDQPTQITRNLFSYKVLEQAMELGLLQDNFLEKTKNDFSHLYSILSNPDTRAYLGLGKSALKAEQIQDDPIDGAFQKQLGYLMTWLFGSPDGMTVSIIARQGQDRPALQKVIASEEALYRLERTGDFEDAKRIAGIDIEDWLVSVFDIENRVKRVWDSSSDVIDTLSTEEKLKARDSLKDNMSKLQNLLKLL